MYPCTTLLQPYIRLYLPMGPQGGAQGGSFLRASVNAYIGS